MTSQKQWQDVHHSIPVPQEMDYLISRSIEKGTYTIKKKRAFRSFRNTALCILLFVSVLFATINTNPAFAEQVSRLPGGSKLVQIIQWNRPTAIGGDITDGGAIDNINVGDANGSESIIFNLSSPDPNTYVHYELKYHEYPYSIVLTLSGVRQGVPIDYLDNINEGTILKGIYPMITLDDSSFRFLILLNKPVSTLVEEDREERTLTLTFKEEDPVSTAQSKYSLRTSSLPYEETVGIIESILLYEFDAPYARTLVDDQGMYLIEEGMYESQTAALERKAALEESGFDFLLMVEDRTPEKIPASE
jgi:hypothetical protein